MPYLPTENFYMFSYSSVVKNNINNIYKLNEKKTFVIPIYSYKSIEYIDDNIEDQKNNICLIMIGRHKYIIYEELRKICYILDKQNIDLLVFESTSVRSRNKIFIKIAKKFKNVKLYHNFNNNDMYTTIFKYKYKI